MTRLLLGFGRPVTALRLVDEGECVLAVLVAIGIAHVLGAQNVAWAAFSGYMVMRGHLLDSLQRAALRVLGTVTGAAVAVVLTPVAASSWLPASAAVAVAGGITLYGALTGKRAYAWLFAGLTVHMVVLGKLEHPRLDVVALAGTRVLEVFAGSAACVLVSTVSTMTIRRRWPGKRLPPALALGWQPHALRHALQGAMALALLPPLWAFFGVPEVSQGAISIMAVMLVPVSSLGVSGLGAVSARLLYRVLGCVGGIALAAAVELVAGGSTALLIAGSLLGVALGRNMENSGQAAAYVGTQFTLAVLVALVPDSYADADLEPAWDRLIGIGAGLAMLEPVLAAWHVVRRRSAPA